MSKPEDVSQDAWNWAVITISFGYDDPELQHLTRVDVARAIMSAVAVEREECARIAESYIDPIDIAHHIRKRGVAE